MTKKIPKLKTNFTIILVVLLTLSIIINTDFIFQRDNNYRNLEGVNDPQLKKAGHWNLNSIYIDDSDPNYNWSKTAEDNLWLNGYGTEENPYIIENVTVDAQNLGIGIDIRYSSVFFIIRNCTVYNSGVSEYGINLYNVNNGKITNNNISFNDDHGLFIHGGGGYSNNFVISNNTISNNSRAGISFEAWVDNSIIFENTIFNNGQDGIVLRQDSDNNTIYNNKVYNNGYSGILLQGGSDNNVVKENNISDSNHQGIWVYGNSSYNTIKGNNISKSGGSGVLMEESPFNIVTDNNLFDNNLNGVRFKAWSGSLYKNINNTITGNIIKGNLGKGASIDEASFNNLIYLNEFINNNIKTEDNGTNNLWDNGSIGNYWDDYGGDDADDDGIGDTPYSIMGLTGSQDNFPIWQDTDDVTPNVTIISPVINQFFGNNAPNFDLTIVDQSLNTTWYTIDNELTNYTFSGFTGTINQTAWDKKENGLVTIRFYANDSVGRLNFANRDLIKDTIAPVIIINSPTSNQSCGLEAPTFNLTIEEVNIHEKWYSFNGGKNITFTTETQFNLSEWVQIGDGLVIVKFYVRDKAGNMNSSEVIIRKDVPVVIIPPPPEDTDPPVITIILPNDNSVFGDDSPTFIVEITDSNLQKMWYSLDGGVTNTTFTTNGTIDQSLWDLINNGTVFLRFYANDTVGNIGFEEVLVRKQVSNLEIKIILPLLNDTYGLIPPNFSISVSGSNIGQKWYSLDNGLNNYTFEGLNGTINQIAWDNTDDGSVIIKFCVNNSLGDINYDEVVVIKDTTGIEETTVGTIIGYDLLVIIGIIGLISIIFLKKLKKSIKSSLL